MIKKPVIIFFTWLIIWLFIAFQYSSDQLIPFDDKLGQENDFKEIISILDSDKVWLNNQLNDLEKEVFLITKWKEQSYDDFDELKIEAWQWDDLTWNWVEMNIKWSVNASNLRDLINVLREIGVDAIAVWSQRVIYSTPIIDLNDTILVWNTRFKSPIIIYAIWDINQISSIVSDSPILKSLREKSIAWEIEVELIKKDVVIPKI